MGAIVQEMLWNKLKGEQAFALPTLIIVGTILMIVGMSSLQVASSIGKSLQDIRWNSMARNAAEAGISYASSCLEDDAEVYEQWTASKQLKPGTNCQGAGGGGYLAEDSSARWRSKFSVSYIPQGEYKPPKIVSKGTVERLNVSGVVISTHIRKKEIILNLPVPTPIPTQANSMGATSFGQVESASAGISGSSGPCLVSGKGKLYCTIKYTPSMDSGFPDFIAHRINVGGAADLSVSQAAGGLAQACALASDSQVYCLGANGVGQLGDGSTTFRSAPVKFSLPGSLSAKAVLLSHQYIFGSIYTCVIASNNQVYCAGSNGSGQLGDGSSSSQATPVRFGLATSPTVLTARAIALSFFYSCVLASDSQVYCAGENGYGQLGNGVEDNDELSPVKFNLPTSPTILTAKAVAVSDRFSGPNRRHSHTCVLASDNQVYCAGSNGSGQLGDGTTTNRSTAVKFKLDNAPTGATAKQISAGSNHTCALASDNQVYCAGYNHNGQLGDGTTTDRSTAVKFSLPGANTAKLVAAVNDNTCVLTSDSQIYCAGVNGNGQLGDGSTIDRSTPVQFSLPGGVLANNVYMTSAYICAQASNNHAYCAGLNDYSRLGNGTNNNPQASPLPILY